MDAGHITERRRRSVWLAEDAGDVRAFADLVGQRTDPADWPLAADVARNIPVYDGASVRAARTGADRARLMAEWATIFGEGPGVIVIRGAVPDGDVIDRATEVFEAIIAREKAEGAGSGDHFAKPGANDRVWNALEKHCLADPGNFALYYASDAIAMASEAWLGPAYQVTAQVNRVNPGGAAQTAHRDYHLGFMTPEHLCRYPAHVHHLSPALTLQGGLAHCDMPVESGPTMLLPYSQLYPEGYVAFTRPEFQDVFRTHHVQLPLAKGDAVFFNPALMHAAGENRSRDIRRMVNLFQVGSAFGRSIESVDRLTMCGAIYPVLLAAMNEGKMTGAAIGNVVQATAEGYPFPTNLDRDPPVGGLAPPSQAAVLTRALEDGWAPERMTAELEAHAKRRLT